MATPRSAVLHRGAEIATGRLAAWVCVALLLLVPLVVYWPTVFEEYGFRDDYAHLREADELPGKLIRFTASYGRLLYGPMLVASVRPLDGIEDLQWLRLTSVLLLVLVGLALWRLLLRAGWSQPEAGATGLAVALLPGAQVAVGWSIAWPVAATLLFAIGGFAGVEAALRRRGAARIGFWAGGAALYVCAALTYQSNALFAVVPMAAFLLVRNDPLAARTRWAAAHLATLFAGLVAAFAVIKVVFALGLVPPAGFVQLESNPLDKLYWFVTRPLANALALFVLRDRYETSIAFWIALAVVAAIIVLGFRFGDRTRPGRVTWLFCALCLPLVAGSISLVSMHRSMGYRTIFALAGVVLVLLVYSLRGLRLSGRISATTQATLLGAMLVVAALLAHGHALHLIAEPQNREWTLVRDGARRMPLIPNLRVYVIRPYLEEHRSTARVFVDEFGSLSTNSDWSTYEMFRTALRERFPGGLPRGASYTFATGLAPPKAGAYDFVVDLRRLKSFRND
jgi:hypothetical protein